MTHAPLITRAEDMYLYSPLRRAALRARSGRQFAFLLDYQRWDVLRREIDGDVFWSNDAWRDDVKRQIFDPVRHTLHGFNLYIGFWAPPNGILFLPERTIRSTVGLWA